MDDPETLCCAADGWTGMEHAKNCWRRAPARPDLAECKRRLEYGYDIGVTEQKALVAWVEACEQAIRDLLGSAVEFDDERLGYVVMQVDRCDIDDARALLAPPAPR